MMNKKGLMVAFIKEVGNRKLMTLFISNLFEYKDFHDYNYLYRVQETKKKVIIDIYDNISNNRFNRYLFSFTKGKYDLKIKEDKNVFVSYINVLMANDSDNKLIKFAYLFKINKNRMIDYAQSFLKNEIVECLKNVINNIN